MSWYRKVLWQDFRKEITTVASILVILVSLSLVRMFFGESFVWQEITPFSTPDFWHRAFWSALTFVTLGYGLYKIYFYRILSWLFGSDRSGYRQMKKIIWLGLMYINYQIFPIVVDTLNQIISIVFNFSMMAVYAAPMLLLGLIFGLLLGALMEHHAIAELVRMKLTRGMQWKRIKS